MSKLGAVVSTLVEEVVAGTAPDPYHLRGWIGKHRALPVTADMGGCYALTRAGEVISFTWDNDTVLQSETHPRICRIALMQGIRHYAALRSFAPSPPLEAKVCRGCKGTGRALLGNDVLPEAFVCFCGGLGWLLPGEEGAP